MHYLAVISLTITSILLAATDIQAADNRTSLTDAAARSNAETCLSSQEHAELQRLRRLVESLADTLNVREELEELEALERESECTSTGFQDGISVILGNTAKSAGFKLNDPASANQAIIDLLNLMNWTGNGLCSGSCPAEQTCSPVRIRSSSADDYTLSFSERFGSGQYILRTNDDDASILTLVADCECISGGSDYE